MSEVIYVDEMVGTNAYIDGVLQPKKEGATYKLTSDLIKQTAIKNWLQATADDAMGMEPGDRAMANEALKKIEQLEADLGKCRESRLAETIRDLPEVKAAFERIERLEAVVKSAPLPATATDDRLFWIQYGKWQAQALAALEKRR
jgi:hypothetical protein